MTDQPAAPDGSPRKVTIEYSKNNHDFVITDSGGDPEIERQIGDAFAQVMAAMLKAQGVDTTYTLTPSEPSELGTLRKELAAAQKKLDAIRAALQERPAIMAVSAIEAVLRGE